MSVGHSSGIITDGLVMFIDSRNRKSFKGKPTTNYILNGDWSDGVNSAFDNWETATANGITSERDVYYGKECIKLTRASGSSGFVGLRQTRQLGLQPSTTYTVSFTYAVPKTMSQNLRFYNVEYTANNVSLIDYHVAYIRYATEGWVTYSHTYTTDSTGVSFPYFNIDWHTDASTYDDVIYLLNVQLEEGDYATPFVNGSRSDTDAIIDICGNTDVIATDITWNPDYNETNETFGYSFDGSGDIDGNPKGNNIEVDNTITSTSPSAYPEGATYDIWLMVDDSAVDRLSLIGESWINHIEIYSISKKFRTESALTNQHPFNTGAAFPYDCRGVWSNFQIVFDNVTTGRPVKWYQNGVLFDTADMIGTNNDEYFSFVHIGRSVGDSTANYSRSFHGQIGQIKIYSKPFTEAEVKQNFNAQRKRYGL